MPPRISLLEKSLELLEEVALPCAEKIKTAPQYDPEAIRTKVQEYAGIIGLSVGDVEVLRQNLGDDYIHKAWGYATGELPLVSSSAEA